MLGKGQTSEGSLETQYAAIWHVPTAGPATPEQEDQLQMLQEALRQVEAQQMELKKSVDVITQKKQKEEVERELSAKEKTQQVESASLMWLR